MIKTDFDSGMLSYLGDAVWELLVREHIFNTVPHSNKKANAMALSFVTARAQCEALEKILPTLSDEENYEDKTMTIYAFTDSTPDDQCL